MLDEKTIAALDAVIEIRVKFLDVCDEFSDLKFKLAETSDHTLKGLLHAAIKLNSEVDRLAHLMCSGIDKVITDENTDEVMEYTINKCKQMRDYYGKR